MQHKTIDKLQIIFRVIYYNKCRQIFELSIIKNIAFPD